MENSKVFMIPRLSLIFPRDQLAGHIFPKGDARHHGRCLQRKAGCDPTGRQGRNSGTRMTHWSSMHPRQYKIPADAASSFNVIPFSPDAGADASDTALCSTSSCPVRQKSHLFRLAAENGTGEIGEEPARY